MRRKQRGEANQAKNKFETRANFGWEISDLDTQDHAPLSCIAKRIRFCNRQGEAIGHRVIIRDS
jgi:hypothetical protein